MPNQRSKHKGFIGLYLEQDLRSRLLRVAQAADVTVTEFLTALIRERLAHAPDPSPAAPPDTAPAKPEAPPTEPAPPCASLPRASRASVRGPADVPAVESPRSAQPGGPEPTGGALAPSAPADDELWRL